MGREHQVLVADAEHHGGSRDRVAGERDQTDNGQNANRDNREDDAQLCSPSRGVVNCL